MLGTPSRGTEAAVQLLNGRARLVQMLALLEPGKKLDPNDHLRSQEAANQVAGVFSHLPRSGGTPARAQQRQCVGC